MCVCVEERYMLDIDVALIGIPVGEPVRIVHRDTKPELCVNWHSLSRNWSRICASQNGHQQNGLLEGCPATLHSYGIWVSDT